MLTKIKLYYQIREFYNIFGKYLGSNFINNLSDITKDNLYDVLFDLNEVLEGYEGCTDPMTTWLNNLYTTILNYCDRKPNTKKIIITILKVLLVAYCGWVVFSIADILSKNLSDYNMLSVCIKLLGGDH